MHYPKEKYEKLIAESPLFSINREEETSAYKRESYKMIEYLYCYLMAVNEKEYEPYACEIMEVSTRCIGNYDNSKGTFLHYFSAAWKQEFSHLVGDRIIENKLRGIKVTEEEKRNIRKMLKLSEAKDSDRPKDELLLAVANAMQLPVDKVKLIAELCNLHVSGDIIKNDDGEEISVWDQVTNGFSIEEEMTEADSIEDLLQRIDGVFSTLQDRQKPIVSDLITAKIWSLLSKEQSRAYGFISHEVIDICERTHQAPTQREIAGKYNRDEASISRTVKDFTKKLQNSLREA